MTPVFDPCKRAKPAKASVHFYINEDLWAAVCDAALNRGMSQGEFAAQAFRFALDHMEPPRIYRCNLCGGEQVGPQPAFCSREGCKEPFRASGIMKLVHEDE